MKSYMLCRSLCGHCSAILRAKEVLMRKGHLSLIKNRGRQREESQTTAGHSGPNPHALGEKILLWDAGSTVTPSLPWQLGAETRTWAASSLGVLNWIRQWAWRLRIWLAGANVGFASCLCCSYLDLSKACDEDSEAFMQNACICESTMYLHWCIGPRLWK